MKIDTLDVLISWLLHSFYQLWYPAVVAKLQDYSVMNKDFKRWWCLIIRVLNGSWNQLRQNFSSSYF